MKTWLKLHHEIITDPKLVSFTPQQKWAWVTLLCLASQSRERGTITTDEDDLIIIAGFASASDWHQFRDKLISKDMLIDCEGVLRVSRWEERQEVKPSDRPEAVRERVARHRNRVTRYTTQCNATDIELELDQEREIEKDLDQELRQDPDQDLVQNSQKNPPPPPKGEPRSRSKLKKFSKPDFEKFWNCCEPKQGKAEAEKAFLALGPDSPDLETLISARTRQQEAAIASGQAQFLKRPPAWLRARRWEDSIPEKPQPGKTSSPEAERFLRAIRGGAA